MNIVSKILIILGIIFILFGFLSGFNYNTLSDAKKVRVGMPVDSLTTLLGKPFQIEVNKNNEYWHFKYNSSLDGTFNGMRVEIVKDTISDFHFYKSNKN